MSRLAALLALLFSSGCFEAHYLAGQALGQWHLFRARVRVSKVLADPSTDEKLRAHLELAMAARKFGIEVLGLHGGDNFTRYLPTHGKPIAWNITVAPRDQLRPFVWRFPLVGAVPYLGYFDQKDARALEAAMKAKGYDTYVRPVAGYSTIGIAADPIYESMIDEGDARIVEVVLHEMLHGTIYLSGHSSWNESFASFVGVHGAAMFFASRQGDEAGRKVLEEAEQRERDEEKFGQFLQPLNDELAQLYAEKIPRAAKLARREAIFAATRKRYDALYPGHRSIFSSDKLNNAVVVSYGVYHHGAPEHERLFLRERGDLAKMIALYKHAVDDTDDPLGYLAQF